MEGLLSVLHSVSSAESNYFNIYVEGLDDQVFGLQSEHLHDVVQNISSLLAKATTRSLGLRLLNKFIDQCSVDVFNKTGNLWTSLTLKACSTQMCQNEPALPFEALGRIASKSLQTPELTKSFATGHLSKVYESLNSVPLSCVVPALRCVEICLRLYPSSSGPSRKTIEKFLSRHHDSLDADVTLYSGKCLHLLQQASGGEVRSSNQKHQWKIYQIQLAGSIHSIFNDMFANINEIWDDNLVHIQLAMEELALSPDPVNRAAQLYVRFHNLVQYMILALKEPFPAEKPILPKMLLGIINRGLSVTCNLLHQNPITDNIALALLLPKIHIDLLRLLDVLTCTLRSHLLPHYNLILGLLMDTLRSTSAEDNSRTQKPFGTLRSKIYESISLWCKVHSGGSRCEVIAEHLINEILADITPKQSELTLQVCAGAGKHMSKKMKRQLHKAQNERSKISQVNAKGVKLSKEPQKEDRNHVVCVSALRCLQEVLLAAASFLKPTKIKLLQTTIIQICASFYELTFDSADLYGSALCRLEIYNSLFVMVTTPHHLCPPPMDLILSILHKACSRDGTVHIRIHCCRILQNLEKLVHPQKESLVFPIDGRDIRNAFIMLGQGRLLEEATETSLDNYESDEEPIRLHYEDTNETVNNDNVVDLVGNGHAADSNLPVQQEDEDVQLLEPEDDDDCKIISAEKLVYPNNMNETENNSENTLGSNNSVVMLDKNGDVDDVNSNLTEQADEDVQLVEPEDDDCKFVSSVGSTGSVNNHRETEIDLSSEEPMIKRPKIDEKSETIEIAASGDQTQNVCVDTVISDMDEDQLLEDIASAFVDDLA